MVGTNVDGGPIVVNLIGQVCDPMDCDFLTRFLADHEQPKWLEFPPQPIGGSAGRLALKTFAYEGHVGSTFNVRLSGGDADSFEITSTSCSGEERPDCAFEIVFRPRKEGPLATELIIYGPGITGAWFDPAQSGHGLFIEVLNDKRFFAWWFAFNPAGTEQSWFGGVGTYSGNTATITDEYQTIGRRWIPNFDPSRIVNSAWGTLTITFTDCNHGRVDFNSVAGYGTGSMNLTRLPQPAGLSCP